MIEIDDVSVSFGDLDVLESVSASIPSGRFVGLVGPNGAGKTTLLRATSGVLEPDRGTVTVDGVDVHALSSRESSQLVSVVPQDTSVSFSFDVRHVVEMGRTPYRSRFAPPDESDLAVVDHALERTGTTHLADRPIDAVSGGERQRVVLARAIAQDTPVVLLDEPTASLDVNHQVETLELVSELVADGKTAVAAIHDLDLAARFCDELVVLADGTIIDRGPPERVLTGSRIERAFEASAAISVNPITWTPSVTALAAGLRSVDLPNRVHVLGIGPTAADVLTRLVGAGVRCTIGPVPEGDAAAVTARHLDVDRIVVEPFRPVDERAADDLERYVDEAEVTVLADCRLGTKHSKLLEPVFERPTVVVDASTPGGESRDTDPQSDRSGANRRGAVRTDPEGLLEAVSTAAATTSPTTTPANRPADDD